MKKTATTFAAFLLGAVLGFFVAPILFQWLASAFVGPLVVTTPGEMIATRSRFAIGCGILPAAAVIFSSSLRRFFLYLTVGLLVSIGAAALYRASYVSSAALLPADLPSSVVLLEALPALRIPLLGAVAIACLALVLHVLAGRREKRLTADRNA